MENPPSQPPTQRAPARRVREVLPLALLAVACGSALHEPTGCRSATGRLPARGVSSPMASSSADSAPPRGAVFDSLASRAPLLAPGMREAARKESTGDKVEVARASDHDLCVRVAFEAVGPVAAKLVDADGHVLAATEKASSDGALGASGPVCIRRGGSVSAVAEGAGPTVVRWVAWESP